MITFALIGAGANVYHHHRQALEALPGQIVALVDVEAAIAEARARELGCAFYRDYRSMLREVRPDVAVILTPTFLHAPLAIACLHAGCHVLVEKPMALHVAEADAMIATAAHCQRSLGVVFQQRFRPEIIAAKALLEEERLGKLQYIEVFASCPRPAAYYRAASWRGTWAGEGGGVIMNQAPHHLDLLCYLMGMPSRITAWTHRLLHAIETEDTVQAMLEWRNGAVGSFCASTAIAGGAANASEQDTITLMGTAGSLRIQQGDLSFVELDTDTRDFVGGQPQPFPAARQVALQLPSGVGNHLAVYQTFCQDISCGRRQTGEQARLSLEIANGLILSGQLHQEVDVPLNRQAYTRLLHVLQELTNAPAYASRRALGTRVQTNASQETKEPVGAGARPGRIEA